MIKRIVLYGFAAVFVSWLVFVPRSRNVIVTGKILSAQEQKLWINEVLTHQSRDGKIIQDILADEQIRNSDKFKISSILATNRSSTYTVVILYWIGKERGRFKDLGDLGFENTKGWFGRSITPLETSISQALERGEDSFITAVDDVYRQRCIDPTTQNQRC